MRTTRYCREDAVYKSQQSGYSLLELMIAMVISLTLMMGISVAYTSIKGLILSTKNIENAQEVIRFSARTFTRSLRQTGDTPTVNPTQLTVIQQANTIACNGSKPVINYSEIYSLSGQNLQCDIGLGPETILTGVEDIHFSISISGRLITINVTPKAQEGTPDGEGPAQPIQIDIALGSIILKNAQGV